MALSDLDRQLLGDDSEDERLESEEAEQDQQPHEGMESQEDEDEHDREEREEDAKLLDEVEAALDAEEAAAGNSEEATMATMPAAAEQATPSTSSGHSHSTDSTSSPQAGSGQASSLAKRDNRMLARREDGLSVSQHRALAMLAQGLTIPQAAMKAGIGRTTLYRWTQEDPQFRAAYNTWKQEQRESCRAALMKCADAAVARIAQRVENDENLAFKVVKELGLFKDSEESAVTDPTLVHHQIEIRNLAAEQHLQRQHLRVLCEKVGVSEEQARAYFARKKFLESVGEGKDKGRDESERNERLPASGTEGQRDGESQGRRDRGTKASGMSDRPRAGQREEDEDEDEEDLDEDEFEDEEDEEDDEGDGTDEDSAPSIPGLNSMLQSLMRQRVKRRK